MAITINEDAKKAYKKYIAAGMTIYGACGLLGNQYAESAGFIPKRVEFLLLQRFREDGKPTTMEQYTKDVDAKKISRVAFLRPRGKHYGYGLSQWTTDSRKAGLYDRTVAKGKSIADVDEQIAYTVEEMKAKFQTTLKVLCSAKSVNEASDYVLIHYEAPAGVEGLKATRRSYSQQFYDFFKNAKEETKMGTLNDLLKLAESENGYLEKASDRNLDSKTGNAGSANFTKYARDLTSLGLMGCQGQAWCGVYQMWLQVKTEGKAQALKDLGPYFYNCFETMKWAKKNNKWMDRGAGTPKAGYRVVFSFSHIGLIIDVKNGRVYTSEGNTSGTAYERNGGMVYKKDYALTDQKILGYVKIEMGSTVNEKTTTKIETLSGLVVTATELNVRSTPDSSKESNIIGVLHKGDRPICDKRIYNWFHFSEGWISGKHLEGWIKEAGKKWHLNNGYTYKRNQWQSIEGKWYFFDKNGWMCTDTVVDWNGSKYYLGLDGIMVEKKWVKKNSKWYYFKTDGSMAKGGYIKSTKKDTELYYWVSLKDGVWKPQWNTNKPNLKKYEVYK